MKCIYTDTRSSKNILKTFEAEILVKIKEHFASFQKIDALKRIEGNRFIFATLKAKSIIFPNSRSLNITPFGCHHFFPRLRSLDRLKKGRKISGLGFSNVYRRVGGIKVIMCKCSSYTKKLNADYN